MSINKLDSKIKELRELKRMADSLNAEIETIQDSIKEEMATREVDELAGRDWKITWKLVKSRFRQPRKFCVKGNLPKARYESK